MVKVNRVFLDLHLGRCEVGLWIACCLCSLALRLAEGPNDFRVGGLGFRVHR